MGRKIPGRKHKGVNDPLKQQAVKLSKIKHKINAPPTKEDDEYIPKSLQRVMDLKTKVKEGKIPLKMKPRKRKSNKNKLIIVDQPRLQQIDPKQRPEKSLPTLKQKVGESDERFLFRVSRICNGIVMESKFEDKYKVDVKRNVETGAVEGLIKKPRDVLDEEKLKKPRLTKSQKKQIKLKEKKMKKEEELEVDKKWPNKEEIKFGEIVHQPPSLSAPRKAENKEKPRPGKRNLLLQNILDNKKTGGVEKPTIDRTSKRKNLPQGLRRQLEKQRDEVVNAYKLLKAKKQLKNQ